MVFAYCSTAEFADTYSRIVAGEAFHRITLDCSATGMWLCVGTYVLCQPGILQQPRGRVFLLDRVTVTILVQPEYVMSARQHLHSTDSRFCHGVVPTVERLQPSCLPFSSCRELSFPCFSHLTRRLYLQMTPFSERYPIHSLKACIFWSFQRSLREW